VQRDDDNNKQLTLAEVLYRVRPNTK